MPTIEDFLRARAARVSPEYAKYLLETEAERATAERSHPTAVARAFAAVQQYMKEAESNRRSELDQKYNQTFRIPQSLESFEAARPSVTPLSPIEQWRQRIEAMMATGNPVLQKQAMGEMQAQAQEEAKPAPNEANAVREYQYAVGQGYKGSFAEWKQANRASTTVHVDQGRKYLSREDILHLVDRDGKPLTRIPAALTYDEVASRGWSFSNMPTAEEAKTAGSTEASEDMLNRLEELVATGSADISGITGIITDFRSQSGVANAAADYLLNVFSVPKNPADIEAHSLSVALGNQLLQAFRGAQVGPAEKEDFIKQLPVAGQPKDVFQENLRLTKRNLEIINKKKAEARGFTVDESKPKTWIKDGYEYRIGPGGKTQRRKL